MFDFMSSDWFNITLEIIFVLLISYDIKKYLETKKREYIINIVLTIGFAVWTLYPFYNSYLGWNEQQKEKMLSSCIDINDTKLCQCIDDSIFKEYIHDEYILLDKNATDYKDFLKEAKEDCLDDSWF